MELTAPMTAALCFFGGVMACLLVCMALKLKAAQAGGRKQQKKDKPPATVGKRMGAMDKILIVLGVFLLCFIVAMVVIFIKKDSIPDTLVQCVFGACGLEGGVMGWIKTTKERRQMHGKRNGRQRKWRTDNGHKNKNRNCAGRAKNHFRARRELRICQRER